MQGGLDWPQIIVGAIGVILCWLGMELWRRLNALEARVAAQAETLAEHRVTIASDYARRSDIVDLHAKIDEGFARIMDRIDRR